MEKLLRRKENNEDINQDQGINWLEDWWNNKILNELAIDLWIRGPMKMRSRYQ